MSKVLSAQVQSAPLAANKRVLAANMNEYIDKIICPTLVKAFSSGHRRVALVLFSDDRAHIAARDQIIQAVNDSMKAQLRMAIFDLSSIHGFCLDRSHFETELSSAIEKAADATKGWQEVNSVKQGLEVVLLGLIAAAPFLKVCIQAWERTADVYISTSTTGELASLKGSVIKLRSGTYAALARQMRTTTNHAPQDVIRSHDLDVTTLQKNATQVQQEMALVHQETTLVSRRAQEATIGRRRAHRASELALSRDLDSSSLDPMRVYESRGRLSVRFKSISAIRTATPRTPRAAGLGTDTPTAVRDRLRSTARDFQLAPSVERFDPIHTKTKAASASKDRMKDPGALGRLIKFFAVNCDGPVAYNSVEIVEPSQLQDDQRIDLSATCQAMTEDSLYVVEAVAICRRT
ncbi:hypothetical protein U1Q18_044845 [Sarracenia purpurea var. burkii]